MIPLLRTVQIILKLLPPLVAVRFGRIVGRIIGLFKAREVAIAAGQMRYVRAFEANSNQSDSPLLELSVNSASVGTLVSKVFGHVGESVVEFLILDNILKSRIPGAKQEYDPNSFRYLTITGGEKALELTRQGKGFVALSAHFGSFEILFADFLGTEND